MALIHYHWPVASEAKPKTKLHIDFSFLRHFVGIFAVSFSIAVWYAILHFGFHVI
jgi:hypothetical protein